MNLDRGNEYISCVNELNKCNVISPGKLNNIDKNPNTGLPFTDIEKETIYSQYNRICNQNEGEVRSCCMPGMESENEYEKTLFKTIKDQYPIAKLFKNSNGQIVQILLSKFNLEQLNEQERQHWTELTPYILCKIYNSEQKEINVKDSNKNNNFLLFVNLTKDCLENTCLTLEHEFTLNHLIGDINSNINYNYMEDSSIVNRINEGDLESLKNYVMKFKSVNNTLKNDFKKNTLLHIASKTKFNNLVEFLLRLRAKTNAENFYGETPIFYAIEFNRINNIESITKQDHNTVNHVNKDGQTPIFKAIKNGNKDILLYLFNKGSSLLVKDNNGNNLVHYTILSNPKHDVVKFLVVRGVSLTEKNNKGQSPLDLVEKKIKEHKKCNPENQNNTRPFETINNLRKVQHFDEKTYSEKLAQLNSILTYINKSSFIEKHNGYEVQNMTSDFESSPVELKDFICYKKIELPTDDRNQTIENVRGREECIEKGGYPVDYNKDELKNTTKIDVKYYKEEELEDLKDEDLFFKQNYNKIQRRPDYVQEVLEEDESDSESDHPHCTLNENNQKVEESFLNAKANKSKLNLELYFNENIKKKNNKGKCPLEKYTKYIILLILFGLVLLFIRNN